MAETRQFKKRAASQMTFQNLQTVIPIYQIELAVLVVVDVVAHDYPLSFAYLRDVVADFLGNIRVGKIDGAQAAAEPGDVKRVAVNLLGGLVRAEAEFMGRFAVEGHDEGCNWQRQGLFSDIDHPEKGVMGLVQLLPGFFFGGGPE